MGSPILILLEVASRLDGEKVAMERKWELRKMKRGKK